jgi:hypothetical protein
MYSDGLTQRSFVLLSNIQNAIEERMDELANVLRGDRSPLKVLVELRADLRLSLWTNIEVIKKRSDRRFEIETISPFLANVRRNLGSVCLRLFSTIRNFPHLLPNRYPNHLGPLEGGK